MNTIAASGYVSSSSSGSADRRSAGRVIRQGNTTTHAYGLKLDVENLHRITRRYHFEIWGDRERITKASPEEVEEILLVERGATLSRIGRQVYRQFPDFPRLLRNIFLLDPAAEEWLFAFKDDSSHEALHVSVGVEDVRKVQEMLGLEHEPARWYKTPYEE